MRSEIDMYKGIRPGKIVGLELQERNLSQRAFAAAIDEHKQTLNAVITGRRKLKWPSRSKRHSVMMRAFC